MAAMACRPGTLGTTTNESWRDSTMAILNGTEGADNFSGTAEDDIINGLGGNDRLIGMEGNDVVNGDAGDDELHGSWGNDTLNGGDGFDIISYLNSDAAVTINL